MTKFPNLVLSAITILLLTVVANGATYVVNKTTDTNDGICDGDCSLREAVVAANATPDNDLIEFSALFQTQQTITLSGTEIVLGTGGSLAINGPGASLLTISGNNASRIISTSPNTVASITGIRFTGGTGAGAVNTGRGGAIYNAGGNLTLTNVVVTGNTAGNGGGINNAASGSPTVNATLTLVNCVISNNTSSSSGGGLQNFSTSTVHMRNTTVSGNTSNSTGIGGAFQANGTVTITNSTFSGNSAPSGTGGGIYFNGTLLTLTNVTVTANTSLNGAGGLHRTGTNPLNIRNSIIAGNNGAVANPDALGAMNSQGNNLIGNTIGSTGWVAADLQNLPAQLGPLAANGGLGNTHVPLTGSPAIDGGQNCVTDLTCSAANPPIAVTVDQRGISRPQNGTVDIGTVEVQAPVIVAGRVVSGGNGIPNILVVISSGNTIIRTARTNGFGNFRLSDVPPAAGYTLTAAAKQYSFPSQNLDVANDVLDLVITATSSPFNDER